eukprot:7382937-Prymnesium_polylepis.2
MTSWELPVDEVTAWEFSIGDETRRSCRAAADLCPTPWISLVDCDRLGGWGGGHEKHLMQRAAKLETRRTWLPGLSGPSCPAFFRCTLLKTVDD